MTYASHVLLIWDLHPYEGHLRAWFFLMRFKRRAGWRRAWQFAASTC